MVHYQRPDTRGQGKSRTTSALALSATLALAITHPLTRAHAQDGAQIQKPVIDSRSVQIQWNTGGDLEIAPSPNGPWTRVNANTSKSSRSELPLELQGHRFFRIVDNGIPGAPQPIVEGDPRRPYRIQAAFLRRAAAGQDGPALLEVQFAPGQSVPPRVPLLLNGAALVFNDAGEAPDTKAGDGSYTATVVLSLEELKETNDFIDALPPDVRKRVVFDGRQVAGVEDLKGFDLAAFARGEAIQVFPAPFGGGIRLAAIPGATASTRARPAAPAPIPDPTGPGLPVFGSTNILHTNIVSDADLAGTNVLIIKPPEPGPIVIGGLGLIILPLPPAGENPPDGASIIPPGAGVLLPGIDDILVFPAGGLLPPKLPPTSLFPNFPLPSPIDPGGGGGGGGDLPPALPPVPPPLAGGDVLRKSLLVTELSAIEDPTRTWDPCRPHAGTRMGAWTFGRLMTDMCNEPKSGLKPSDFVRRWLRSWQTEQVINFDTVTNRNPEILAQVIQDWENASGGPDKPLDLSIAPFRLLAIVNRVDLRGNPGYGGVNKEDPCNPPCVGGEARFVFGVVPGLKKPLPAAGGGAGGVVGIRGGARPAYPDPLPDPNPTNDVDGVCGELPFTVILEYCVPKNTCEEIRQWGLEWYNLSRMPFGPAFNDALQKLTDQFATAGADPRRKPNESALSQLRANDLLRKPWELREWRIFPNDSDVGHLREVTVKQTPDFDLNFSKLIVQYCNAFAPDILAGRHTVPLQFGTPPVPFLGGSAPMPDETFFWDGPPPRGTSLPTPLRHNFSLNTCNGCHAGETGTPFTHVFTRLTGAEAKLSDFLTGLNMPKIDPADGATPHVFADLKRREQDLIDLIITPCFFQIFKDPVEMKH